MVLPLASAVCCVGSGEGGRGTGVDFGGVRIGTKMIWSVCDDLSSTTCYGVMATDTHTGV
jgi:hypothetical protein